MSLMEGINLYHIDYYEKTVFKGSYRGLCFRIGKIETGEDEDIKKKLHVWAWKGPFILEKTTEEVSESDFDFTEEGLIEANEWIEKTSQAV